MDLQDRAIALIEIRFGKAFRGVGSHRGQKWAYVDRSQIVEVLRALRDDLQFEFLMDLTAVDWLGFQTDGEPRVPDTMAERYTVVYQLYSLANNGYFRLKCWVPERDPEIPSAHELWKAAPWAEREVWDMFGIRFHGHPDLRRIQLPFDYTGHPLRKEYPLIGNGERQNFPRYEK